MSNYKNKIIELKNKHFDLLIENITSTIVPCDLSDETIRLLTNWRGKYNIFFASKFNVSENRTKQWLEKSYIFRDDQILFLIIVNNKKIGHIGIIDYNKSENCAEIGHVLRGDRENFPGIMKIALTKILEIGFDELHLDKFILKVLSDNEKAISLYEICGFTLVDKIPLEKILTSDGWYWTPTTKNDNVSEKYHNIMQITKEQFKNTGKIDAS